SSFLLYRLERRIIRTFGQAQLVGMFYQAARLNEARFCQRSLPYHQPGCETKTIRRRRRFIDEPAAQFGRGRAELQPVAGLQSEAFEQQIRRHRSICALLLAEEHFLWKWRVGLQFPIKGVGIINRLDFHKRLVRPVHKSRHGTHAGEAGDRSQIFKERQLLRSCLALVELETQISTQQDLALTCHACSYGTRNGVDAADRRDSKRDTGKKDEETAQSAAHFTQGKARSEERRVGKECRSRGRS